MRRAVCAGALFVLTAGAVEAEPLFGSDPNFFPIGVWQQMEFNFQDWKNRGVNTLVGVPGGHDKQRRFWSDWHNNAAGMGFQIIRQPDPNISLAADAARPNLVAWMQQDEPDLKNVAPSTLAGRYQELKAAANLPVFTNFSGGVVLNLQANNAGRHLGASDYQAYTTGTTDWVGSDIYPVTGWNRPEWIDYSTTVTGTRGTPGAVMNRLRSYGVQQPQLAVIETSDQNLSWTPRETRGVTPDELRGQVWHSLIHGAKGIVYFSHIFNRFHFDGTPTDVAAEITTQNTRIRSLAAVLNDDWNEDAFGYTESAEKLSFRADPQGLLEGSWRHTADADYFFVLNMSSVTSPLTFRIDGAEGTAAIVGEGRSVSTFNDTQGVDFIRDAFGPWEMHVYRFSKPVVLGAAAGPDFAPASLAPAVPEPASVGIVAAAVPLMLRRSRRR